MARMARAELFAADEIAVVHVMNRVVRKCFLMGTDKETGKSYDHRKAWIEGELRRLASLFGIDLLTFAIMSNHFHLVLRSRPDVVREWTDEEIARRWMRLCPLRKHPDGTAKEPNQAEVNSIATDPDKLKEIRSRLCDISWWMRLLCQRIAQRANKEDAASGKFWENRYRAVRLIDEAAILACSAYVDLNPIRAALAETLEDSEFTSVQRRIQSLVSDDARQPVQAAVPDDTSQSESLGSTSPMPPSPDAFLSPVSIDELCDALGTRRHEGLSRCSDKGFLSLSTWSIWNCWTGRLVNWCPANEVPQEPQLRRFSSG